MYSNINENEINSHNAKISLSLKSKGNLEKAAGFAEKLSIIGFTIAGILTLTFLIGMMILMLSELSKYEGFSIISIPIIMILGCAIPSLFLNKFSQKTNEAIKKHDSDALETAIKNIKSLYKFIVIVCSIYFFLSVLALMVSFLNYSQ